LIAEHRRAVQFALDTKRESGNAGSLQSREIAHGSGWSVLDMICTSEPHDRMYEESHALFSVSFVLAGSFTHRSADGRALLIPGAVLLGSRSACFECGHEHGEGDRCLSFQYEPALFEEVAADSGAQAQFGRSTLPPQRKISPLLARMEHELVNESGSLEELSLHALAVALRSACNVGVARGVRAEDERRVWEAVRYLEHSFAAPVSIARLAAQLGLGRFHFLRVFQRLTGTTPHQFVLRLRLRTAAARLIRTVEPVTTIALDVGFNDLSNFMRTFRAEFGVSPARFRTNSKHAADSGAGQ
jgi:AraC family transcriptional regulator